MKLMILTLMMSFGAAMAQACSFTPVGASSFEISAVLHALNNSDGSIPIFEYEQIDSVVKLQRSGDYLVTLSAEKKVLKLRYKIRWEESEAVDGISCPAPVATHVQ